MRTVALITAVFAEVDAQRGALPHSLRRTVGPLRGHRGLCMPAQA